MSHPQQQQQIIKNKKDIVDQAKEIKEQEKLIAEKLNGRFAMVGFIALVGAYLTTGQIIPGFI